jgi:hypothetical protein
LNLLRPLGITKQSPQTRTRCPRKAALRKRKASPGKVAPAGQLESAHFRLTGTLLVDKIQQLVRGHRQAVPQRVLELRDCTTGSNIQKARLNTSCHSTLFHSAQHTIGTTHHRDQTCSMRCVCVCSNGREAAPSPASLCKYSSSSSSSSCPLNDRALANCRPCVSALALPQVPDASLRLRLRGLL